jgi:RES domain-containing protein
MLTDRRSAVLCVPSVVVPREFNYVINPRIPSLAGFMLASQWISCLTFGCDTSEHERELLKPRTYSS